ncbi:hypothetical protein [Lachnoclostridium phytofermentans]|uniref:Uncharacterized protein n=1 Tax=Lachnoclostridium phytofermentans (strain ATCC 700394 / DSM 18823 / ISDg) TaxID=357809 RepID=A9KNJ1_LACP7|nr:hypothetical protein [Lachnoclostridium phytofermentans]ABX43108.1 hypothetical protein Cphy_2747 [Lachnoclostridium phytofermentans ISDg]
MLYYKDYEVTATGLININTSHKTDFELSEFGLATACVYNNVLYRNFKTFEALDLKDGSHITFNTSTLDEANEQISKNAFSSLFAVSTAKPQILDYTILDDEIYFCFYSPVISRYEDKNEKLITYIPSNQKTYDFLRLYTDTKNLYALRKEYTNRKTEIKIVKIIFHEDELTFDMEEI